MAKTQISLTVNGKPVEALVEPRTLLIHFLRDELRLTGPHVGCDTTHCGACTVDLDGKSVKSCTVFAVQADGADVLTIEGMAQADGTLHPLQAGLPRASRAAMRLLHAGHDHPRLSASCRRTRTRRRTRSASASPAISAAAPATRTS